jgi:hypothetical protein
MTYLQYNMIYVIIEWSFELRPTAGRASSQETLSSISLHSKLNPKRVLATCFIRQLFGKYR